MEPGTLVRIKRGRGEAKYATVIKQTPYSPREIGMVCCQFPGAGFWGWYYKDQLVIVPENLWNSD